MFSRIISTLIIFLFKVSHIAATVFGKLKHSSSFKGSELKVLFRLELYPEKKAIRGLFPTQVFAFDR
jgi:hypothetical protein